MAVVQGSRNRWTSEIVSRLVRDSSDLLGEMRLGAFENESKLEFTWTTNASRSTRRIL